MSAVAMDSHCSGQSGDDVDSSSTNGIPASTMRDEINFENDDLVTDIEEAIRAGVSRWLRPFESETVERIYQTKQTTKKLSVQLMILTVSERPA